MSKNPSDSLRSYLQRQSLSVEKVASDLGVSVASVYRWLGGKTPQSRVVRRAIDQYTNGQVSERSWTKGKVIKAEREMT